LNREKLREQLGRKVRDILVLNVDLPDWEHLAGRTQQNLMDVGEQLYDEGRSAAPGD
jgi:hypothetical protein